MERLNRILPFLISYYKWLALNRQNENGFYWISPLGCGMDNTPRYAACWVDFSAQQLDTLCIARIAEALGMEETSEELIGTVISGVSRFFCRNSGFAPNCN